VSFSLQSQDISGKWKTIDDATNEAKSVVEIYKENGKYFGKIIELLKSNDKGSLCDKCTGEKKNRPVEGLLIIENMLKKGRQYKDGEILDPENGKTYNCKIWVDKEDPNTLNVRGYIAFFYRTQYWKRVN